MSNIRNRELSQFGSFVYIEDTTQNIGIATQSVPYVGIGTTNPQSKLHVVGDVKIDGNLDYQGQLSFGDVNISTSGIITASSYFNTLGQQLVGFDSWTAAGSNIYRLIGNVGIGTSVITNKLEVLGSVSATSFIGNITGTNGNFSGIVTASSFVGSLTGTATGLTGTPNITIDSITGTNGNFSGIVTASSFIGSLTGTATTATNLENAANITTGTINSARLSGSYNITATNVVGGISSVTSLNVTGISTLASTTSIDKLAIGQLSLASNTSLDLSGSYVQTVQTVSVLDIDCSTGNYFIKTINGNSTFTFSTVPASRAYSFTLELTHTSGSVTWPSAVKWPADVAPTLTTGKTHLFFFVTDDGGTRWRGSALVDYVN